MLELNKIYNIDCIDGLKQLRDESVDLIIIDPPFNSETKMGSPFRPNSKAKMSEEEWFIYNNMSSRGYITWMNNIFKELYRVLKKGSHVYTFCNWKNIRNTMDVLEVNFFVQKDLLVWDKEHFGVGFFYRPQTEFILFSYKGTKPKQLNSNAQANIIRLKRVNNPYSLVQKPVELIKKFIELSTQEGDIVLDCFIGTGTTAIASKETKRNFLGFEISKKWYEIANRRLEQTSLSLPPKRIDTIFSEGSSTEESSLAGPRGQDIQKHKGDIKI